MKVKILGCVHCTEQ